jgi:hypothetical protein
MEFRRPQRDESPNEGLVERHRREIFPLLRQRWRFAGASGFRQLAAFDGGAEVVDVFAYANRAEHGPADAVERRSLVVYLNRYPRAQVRIPGVAEALGLAGGPNDFLILRDQRSGLDYLRGLDDLRTHGLELSLDGYACHVFLGFEEVSDAGGAGWGELAMRIGLGGVPDAHLALRRQREEPVRAAVAAVLATRLAQEAFLPVPEGPARVPTVQAPGALAARVGDVELADVELADAELAAALANLAAVSGTDGASPASMATMARLVRLARALRPRLVAQAVAGSLLGTAIGEAACGGDRARSLEVFDDWEAAAAVGDLARRAGSGDAQAWRSVELARALLALPPGALAEAAAATGLPATWFEQAAVRAASGWNEWQGARYLSQEAWAELLETLAARDTLLGEAAAEAAAAELRRRAASSGYRLAGSTEGTATSSQG